MNHERMGPRAGRSARTTTTTTMRPARHSGNALRPAASVRWTAMNFACAFAFACVGAGPARAQESTRRPEKSVTSDVGFDQKLGARLPLGASFRDEAGHARTLGELLGGRPVLLVPVYYQCPMLCNQTLNGLTRSLKPLALDAGKDFDVVAFSFNPNEKPELAARKKANYLERYDRPGAEAGWRFLTGDAPAIEALTRAIGFRYTYNPNTKLYSHAAGIVVVTPDGRTSRYFYGIDYPARELQDEIARARRGEVAPPISRLLLLCYDYDSATGKYTLSIIRLTRVLGTLSAAALATYLIVMLRRERRGEIGPNAAAAALEAGLEVSDSRIR